MKYSIILLFSILNLSCKKDCSDLKNGTFQLNGFDKKIHTITRNGNVQTEKLGESGTIIQFNIEWTSNCSYKLYNRKIIKGKEISLSPLDTLYFDIVKLDGNKHKVTSKLKGIDEVYESVLTKIN